MDLWVEVRPLDTGRQLPRHPQRDPIPPLGPIQRYPSNAPLSFVSERVHARTLELDSVGVKRLVLFPGQGPRTAATCLRKKLSETPAGSSSLSRASDPLDDH